MPFWKKKDKCKYKALHTAAFKGDLKDVKRHLQKGCDVNEGFPLILASGQGFLHVVKYLVEEAQADLTLQGNFYRMSNQTRLIGLANGVG